MPNYPATIVTPEERLFVSLTNASAYVQKIAEEALKDTGITLSEYTFLRVVEHVPGITAVEVRTRLYATAPSVAQTIARLEKRGVIRREQSKNDARRFHLFLTQAGRRKLLKAKYAILSLMSQLELSPALLQSLTKELSIFLSSLPPYDAA